MHLIAPLAAGLPDAQDGHVALLRRGTATAASYYRDFEATQVFTATPIALDSSGSTVLYVNELVDVIVYDADGVQVREFVAGVGAPAVEVISRAFTGVDYRDGSGGTSKPTTLAAILDMWATSAGAADWKVQTQAGAVSLMVAVAGLQGLFFNVKSYGALGDGSANDAAAIQAAITAAGIAGGIVIFPSGVYRCDSSIVLPNNVTLMGVGAPATKIAFNDSAVTGFLPAAGTAGATPRIIGMWLGAYAANLTGALVSLVTAGARADVYDCVFGNDATKGVLVAGGTPGPVAMGRFTRCSFVQQSTSANAISTGALTFRDCEFRLGATMPAAPVGFAALAQGSIFDGCLFSGGTATFVGNPVYIRFSPTSATDVPVVTNCTFATYAFGSSVAMQNDAVSPNFDALESNNRFGAGVFPYAYATDGYAAFTSQVRQHASRGMEGYAAYTSASINTDAKFNAYTTIARTAGAALTLNTSTGSQGDEWTVQIYNTTGGVLTVTPTAGVIILEGLAANFTVANGAARTIKFRWQMFGALGRWTQCAPSSVT